MSWYKVQSGRDDREILDPYLMSSRLQHHKVLAMPNLSNLFPGENIISLLKVPFDIILIAQMTECHVTLTMS